MCVKHGKKAQKYFSGFGTAFALYSSMENIITIIILSGLAFLFWITLPDNY